MLRRRWPESFTHQCKCLFAAFNAAFELRVFRRQQHRLELRAGLVTFGDQVSARQQQRGADVVSGEVLEMLLRELV